MGWISVEKCLPETTNDHFILNDELDIRNAITTIDNHFESISKKNLYNALVECGLGKIADCTESGWERVNDLQGGEHESR